ncbi:MAG TPA: murein biosynthesis integral membrane protein MurJ, partial [Chloroflexota bacterium]|nr:murein biosynthesis integral membrane protein MurJ [Chloroflexota bacterium]
LGLAREQTIAALFGTTAVASIFSAVSRVPTMVYDLLIGGAITSALIPVFSEIAGRGEKDAGADRELRTVSGAMLALTLVVLVPVVGALVLAAPWLIDLLGVGFAPDVREQGVLLTRVALPSVVLLGAAAVLMAVLYALHRVTIPSFAAAAYNAGIIGCALLLAPAFGVVGLVVGLLVGAAAQLVLQLVGLRDRLPHLTLALGQPAVRRIMRLYAPVAGGLVISSLVVVLDTRLASLTGEASLAAMRYATQVVQLPLGLVATALSFAVLPVLSRAGGAGAGGAGGAIDPAFRETLALGIRAALVLIAPMTVALMTLRMPVIALLFGYGAFGAQDVAVTGTALFYYAPQLPFVAVDQLLIAAFYALQNTKLPVLVGVVCAGVYSAVALASVQPMGMAGLVLANTVQHGAHAVILFTALAVRHADAVPRGLWAALGRVGAAAALMGVVCLVFQRVVPEPNGAPALAAYVSAALALGGGTYLAAMMVLGGEEVALARSLVLRRMAARRGAGG